MRLSICIATYQRADVIGETLESIISQLEADTELVVVDGASPDNTEAVVTAAFTGRGDCRYVRLPQKGGVDQDYCLAVAEARGDYCWLMTDDDVLTSGAVTRVLDCLSDDPDLMVLNAEVAGPDLDGVLLERKLRIAADETFEPDHNSDLLELAGDLLTFIGSVVIRRELWLSRDPKPYIGTEFIHVGMIFQAPLQRMSRVIARPSVRIRYGRAGWSDRTFEVWMFKWPRLIWSLPGVSDRAREKTTPSEPWRKVGRLANMKAQGAFSLADYRRRLKHFPMGWLTRARLVLMAALPDFLFAWLLRLVLMFRPREREMMEFELRRARKAGGLKG